MKILFFLLIFAIQLFSQGFDISQFSQEDIQKYKSMVETKSQNQKPNTKELQKSENRFKDSDKLSKDNEEDNNLNDKETDDNDSTEDKDILKQQKQYQTTNPFAIFQEDKILQKIT
jgi:hypothetical protein